MTGRSVTPVLISLEAERIASITFINMTKLYVRSVLSVNRLRKIVFSYCCGIFWYQRILFTSLRFCVLIQTTNVIQPNSFTLKTFREFVIYQVWITTTIVLIKRGTVIRTKVFACCDISLQHSILIAPLRFRSNNVNENEKRINELLRSHMKFMNNSIRLSYFIRPIHDEMENTFNIRTRCDSCKFFESIYIKEVFLAP